MANLGQQLQLKFGIYPLQKKESELGVLRVDEETAL